MSVKYISIWNRAIHTSQSLNCDWFWTMHLVQICLFSKNLAVVLGSFLTSSKCLFSIFHISGGTWREEDGETTLPEQPEPQGRGSNITGVAGPVAPVTLVVDGAEDTGDLLLKMVGDAEPLHRVDKPEHGSLVAASARRHQPLPHASLQLIDLWHHLCMHGINFHE